jgi:hypothetical protein
MEKDYYEKMRADEFKRMHQHIDKLKQQTCKLNDVYGPGDDNYGRNKPFWKEMDNCVDCGKETKYPKYLDIDYREHYIEGAGQLCDECAEKLNKKSK